MQHRRALVVDESAEDAAVALDVSQAIPEIDGPFLRLRHAQRRNWRMMLRKTSFAAALAAVERGEVLREPFTQPLLVKVLPAHGLAPPLMCDFVGQKKLGKTIERRRVAPPRQRHARRGLVERGKVRRAVTARQGVLEQRDRERRIRTIADGRRIELDDFCRTSLQCNTSLLQPGIGLDASVYSAMEARPAFGGVARPPSEDPGSSATR